MTRRPLSGVVASVVSIRATITMGGAVQVIAAFVMWNVLRDQDLDADVDHELV